MLLVKRQVSKKMTGYRREVWFQNGFKFQSLIFDEGSSIRARYVVSIWLPFRTLGRLEGLMLDHAAGRFNIRAFVVVSRSG